MILNTFKLYSVHVDPSADRPYETAEFVPEGFNIFAFLFSGIWALYHRLWILAFVLLCLNVLINVLGSHYGFHPASVMVLQTGIQVMVGFQGNDTRRVMLGKKGFIVADMVAAHTLLHAEQRFYDRYLPQFQQEQKLNLAEA